MHKLWWQLVSFGFRLLYNEMAFTYDAVSYFVSMGSWRCWQRAALQFLPQEKDSLVLELAHGTGNLQLDFHAAGYTAIGYDLSAAMGRITKRKLQKNNVPVRLTRGMAQQLPFADASFGAIISTFPTDFIIAPSTLSEIHRLLKPDGALIIVFSGTFTGSGLFKNFLEWLYRITGQRNDTPQGIPPNFKMSGFKAHLEQIDCSHSVSQILVAYPIK
ncbi:MAG: class I SAM-dependent methyltransferase [Aggregatilineales bacterium]